MGQVTTATPGGVGRTCGLDAFRRRVEHLDRGATSKRLLLGAERNPDELARQTAVTKDCTTIAISPNARPAVGRTIKGQLDDRFVDLSVRGPSA